MAVRSLFESVRRRQKHQEFSSAVNRPEFLTPLSHYSPEEVLNRVPVVIATAIIRDGRGFVSVFMRCKQFSHTYVFSIDQETLTDLGVTETQPKKFYGRQLSQLGFEFNGTLFAGTDKNGDKIPVENRYRIILSKTKETYIITESLEDHWQASHSHKKYIEHYYFGRREGLSFPGREEYSVFTLQSDGRIRRDSNRRMLFYSVFQQTYYRRDGEVDDRGYAELVHERFIATEGEGIPHNVWMRAGTIIGTSKVLLPDEITEKYTDDWNAEPEFDAVLTRAFCA